MTQTDLHCSLVAVSKWFKLCNHISVFNGRFCLVLLVKLFLFLLFFFFLLLLLLHHRLMLSVKTAAGISSFAIFNAYKSHTVANALPIAARFPLSTATTAYSI